MAHMNRTAPTSTRATASRPLTWLLTGLAASLLAGCVVAPPLQPPPPPPGALSTGPSTASAPVATGTPMPSQAPASTDAQPHARAPVHAPAGPQGGVQGAQPTGPQGGVPMYFYPERHQTDAQQDRDRFECYRWAVRETGVDPGMTAVRQPVTMELQPIQPLRDGSAVLHSATQGALLGALVSSPRQSGANAVIGALFGAVLGVAAQESRAQAVEQMQYRQQQALAAANAAAVAAARAPTDNFRRAMSACMSGRGYRVG